MAIYTKTGDTGMTSLANGERLLKSDLRIDTYGVCDELNSWVGYLRASIAMSSLLEEQYAQLLWVQNKLFNLGALLSKAPGDWIVVADVEEVEHWIDAMQQVLPIQRSFILPAGSEAVCRCHLCRTVCRRLERKMILLGVEGDALKFVNRMSDYLFVLSRFVIFQNGEKEESWSK